MTRAVCVANPEGDVCMGVAIGHFDDRIGRFQDAKEGVP